MGDLYWVGGAAAVVQVVTVAVTGYDAGTTYKITVGGSNGAPSVILSALAAGSVNATATALAAAWNASTHPYCSGVTAAASTSTVTFTADVAGVPFVIASSVSGGAGTVGAATTATASSGPNHWDTAANWSTGAVPVNSDNVFIRSGSVPILWGLAQSGVTPALLQIEQTYTGRVGLPLGMFTVSVGSFDSTVPEYRTSYLQIGAALARIGESYGVSNATGASLIKLDLGTTNAATTVFKSGKANDSGPAVYLKNTHASSTLKQYDGKVAVCWEVPNETGQLAQIDVYAGSSPQIYVGGGVTLATHNQDGGTGVLKTIPTTLRIENGAAVTTANTASGLTCTTLEKRGDLVPQGQAFAVTNLKG